jgi:signal transduction histidine kinase
MKKNNLIKTLIYLALCLLALLGNKYSIPLFFGVDFIFGSIFVFVIFCYFGFLAAIPAAVIAYGYTYLLWNHPYAIIIFLAELLVVGFICRRQGKNLVFWDVLFWVIIGIPLVFIFYNTVMNLPSQSVSLIMLKQGINGIFNVFVAYIIINFLPPILRSGKRDFSSISFKTIIFTIMLLSLSLPTFVTIAILAKAEFKEEKENIIQELNSAVVEINGGLSDWFGQKVFTISQIATQLNNRTLAPSAENQQTLQLILSVNPDFHNMYVADKNAITTAFYPPVNEKGESTVGIDFSDRDYFRFLKSGRELVISDIFLGRGGVFSPIVTISAPIFNDQQFNGFVLAALKTDHFQNIIKRVAENRKGQITIIDSQQKVIASTAPNRSVLTPYEIENVWDVEEVGDGMYQGFRKEDAQLAQMRKWNKSAFIKTFPLPFNEHWTIIVEIPTQPYIAELNNFYILSLFFLFILSVGSIILSMFISSAIVKSLLQLQYMSTALSKRVENRKLADTWEKVSVSKSSLEIAQLGLAFNLMLAKLEKAQNEQIAATEKAKNQAQLAQKMALFAEAFPFPIMSIDNTGKIETANGAADSAFQKEVKGLNFSDLFPNLTDSFLTEIRQLKEVFFLNISIGSRYFLFTFQLVKQFDVIHVFGTDISKLRQAEDKAHEKLLWEALYHRAGEILHEVGNKTLILVGYLDEIRYIQDELRKADESGDTILITNLIDTLSPEIVRAFETLNVIQEIVDRMSQRKRRIIEKQEINIFSLVRNSIEDEKYKVPSIDFRLKCPKELKQITCQVDEIHLGQILTNLLKNAEHATRSKENQVISVDISTCENCLAVDIIDNGTGIPKEIQTKIFEDGFTTKGDEGKGIGLALCKNLALESDGTLELVWSIENEGSVFRLTLNLNNKNE